MVQWLEHRTANLQAMGSKVTHTRLCGMVTQGDIPQLYILSLTNDEPKQTY